ncbi:MAG: glycosyltransferase family 4 protein [Anaerolineales bacterium]|nr:glycosyltransferase family 4 protein [Anaerolineales bacterium]
MHILIMGQHYAPEEVSGAVLARELAEGLLARGHQVTFVTAAPSYPQDRVFEGYRNVFLGREVLNGVRVIRVWSYISPSRSFWARVLNYGTFSLMALIGGLAAGRVDVMMSASPPLPLGLSAWLVSRLRRVPWLLRVEDLYPETAVNAGVLQNRFAIRFFEWMEKFIYRKAAHISLISEDFRQNLLAKGISAGKLSVLPVWADAAFIRPRPKENGFRRAHGLAGKFVLLYAGNMGHTSALEEVIEAARLLKDEKEIVFVLIGDGVRRDALKALALRYGLENVRFLPYQHREVYAEALAAADVGLVTLNAASSRTSLPSKIFNIMAGARPVLAVAEIASVAASLVQSERCGVVVPPAQPALLADTVKALRNHAAQLEEWGVRGRAALEARYSREVCLDAYDAIFRALSNFSEC